MDLVEALAEHRLATTAVGALGVGVLAVALVAAGLARTEAVVVALSLFVPVTNLTNRTVDVEAYVRETGRGRFLADAALSSGASLVAGLGAARVLGSDGTLVGFATPVAVVFLVGSGTFFFLARSHVRTD